MTKTDLIVEAINGMTAASQKKIMRALRDGAKTQAQYFKVSMERQPLIRYTKETRYAR